MKEKIEQLKKYGLLAITVPLLTGCGGGGGLSGLSSLFGSVGGSSSSSLASIGTDLGTGGAGGDSIATLTNPEPASMLLMGSGMAALAYYKAKNKSGE